MVNKHQVNVTAIGLGGMGGALAHSLIERGHRVTVWNRTTDRAKPFQDKGAALAQSPADAIAASDLIIMCVYDYDAANAILEQPGVAEAIAGKTLVQLSTGLPDQIYAQQKWVTNNGGKFIAGGIIAYPRSIGLPSTVIVYGGDPSFEQHRPTLCALGGAATYVGQDPRTVFGAYFTLSSYMIGSLALFYETAALAKNYGISVDDYYQITRSVSAEIFDGIRDGVGRIANENFAGDQASIALHTAGIEFVCATFKETGIPAKMSEGLLGMLKMAEAQGCGEKDVSYLLKACLIEGKK